MRAHDDFLLRVLAKEVCGEQVGGELRLAHTRGNINYYPLLLALDHIRKDLCQLLVVGADFEAGVHGLGKTQHVVLSGGQTGAFLALLQIRQQVRLLLRVHIRQGFLQGFQLKLGQAGQLHLYGFRCFLYVSARLCARRLRFYTHPPRPRHP